MDPMERARAAVKRFMATHRPTHTRTPKPIRRLCVMCGAPFLATRRDARYCSPAHRQKAHRQRHRK